MAPEDNPRPAPSDGPDLAALVSALFARVERIEQIVTVLQSERQTAAEAPVSNVPPPPPPPRVPHVSPLRHGMNTVEVPGTPVPKTSLEDRLGSQIFNRIAIVAILIGAALGLKLAIDNQLIGPIGRILVGLVAGAGLIVWSERFRRREFAAFSYSLKAIGSGILYLSLWAAFQIYHLLPSEAAFTLMLLVTLWNAWMAWAQASELLAAYAIAGGFATPLLLSTGGNHQVFLFSYLFSIELATIILVRLEEARARSWSRLLLATLAATAAYFIGWYSSFYSAAQLASTSVFIGLFFLAFLTVPLEFAPRPRAEESSSGATIEPVRRHAQVIVDVLLPLGNAVFGSLAFYSVLEDSHNHSALPWVALGLAALYLGVMRLPQTAVAKAVHLSVAVVFLTIAIPLKASGRWITIGWLAEGVALLWIAARLEAQERQAVSIEMAISIYRVLRRLAAVAFALGFCGLIVLPFWLDLRTRTAFFNERFATELAGILALGIAAWIAHRASASENRSASDVRLFTAFPNWLQLAAGATVALNLVALFAGVREIETFWQPGATHNAVAESALQTALSISGFFMLYGAVLLAIGFWKRNAFLRWQALILLVIAILKTFLYDVRSLSQGYRVVSFLGLGVLLLGISFFYVRRTSAASGPGTGH